jgi:enoyl-CoA hydratase/carnithine racemase
MEPDLGTPFLRWEQRGTVGWVTIDRPERRNALTACMYLGIRLAVDHVNANESLQALVVTGVGDVFAPGGDLGGGDDEPMAGVAALLGNGVVPFDAIRESRKPVLAMVNGLCMGGGLLIAMLADVAIASERAVFAAPELRRGVADAYHAAILPEQVGIALARDLLFTGRRLTAAEAQQHGLVARVVPHDDLERETAAALDGILLAAPRARTAMKRLINARYGLVDKVTFDESIAGDEVTEGFAAFMEKRTPAWAPHDLHDSGRA